MGGVCGAEAEVVGGGTGSETEDGRSLGRRRRGCGDALGRVCLQTGRKKM